MLISYNKSFNYIFNIIGAICLIFLLAFTLPKTFNFENRINHLIEADDLEAALSLYNELIEKEGDNINLLEKRGRLYLKLYESENALLDFKKILALEPNNVSGQLGMAKYHAYKFNILPSFGYLEKASKSISTDDEQLSYLSTKGEILIQFNMFKEAEKALFEAISMQPDNYDLIELFVQSLDQQGKNSEVIEYINMVSSENEMTPHSLAKMGQLMNNIALYSEANLYLEQALNMDPNNPDALCYIAYTYMRLNKNKEALKKIEKSIHQNPLKALSYRVRGEILGNMEKYPKACKDLQRAISLDVEENLVEELAKLSASYCQY